MNLPTRLLRRFIIQTKKINKPNATEPRPTPRPIPRRLSLWSSSVPFEDDADVSLLVDDVVVGVLTAFWMEEVDNVVGVTLELGVIVDELPTTLPGIVKAATLLIVVDG